MANAELIFDTTDNSFHCVGHWSIQNADAIVEQFKASALPTKKTITISAKTLDVFDTAGALILLDCLKSLEKRQNKVTLAHFNQRQQDILKLVRRHEDKLHYAPPEKKYENIVERIGRETIEKLHQVNGLVVLIGDLTDKLVRAAAHWRRFQWPSVISNINSAGLKALPILALLSFLIGVVLAYQMGLQLETYGANTFIAYLSGMAIFREFGPLITAIIVAGRTSSAFTAQIGSMKINEEIDALHTMGLSPTELLVAPKVLALVFVFPLLIFWSDVFSILGSMIMSKFMLHISYFDFLVRLQTDVGVDQLALGLYKAPTFALLIALVGCFQGFRVQDNADSVGSQTTKSVVQALFLIIIADAVYSVIYSWLDL